MNSGGRLLEWGVRGIILLGGAALFAYTVVADVSSTVSMIGGGALILGLYFGLTDWRAIKAIRLKKSASEP